MRKTLIFEKFLPFQRKDTKYDEAMENVYDGWEFLDIGEVKKAEQSFRKAIQIYPNVADAFNGLAEIRWDEGDINEAENLYKKALNRAKNYLGTDEINSFMWWLDIETRPYMRAREGLGYLLWEERKDFVGAIKEFVELLRRNKNDNQGVRYLIPSLYQLNGDSQEAYRWLMKLVKDYPDDVWDPHFCFNKGLCFVKIGKFDQGIQLLYEALFKNFYIPALFFEKQKVKELNIWHGTNLAELEYAKDYWGRYLDLWKDPGDASLLGFIYRHPIVQIRLKKWIELAELLKSEEPGKERERLLDGQDKVEAFLLPKHMNKELKSLYSLAKTVGSGKVGRNDPCPCGSGKKYKKCHLFKFS